MDKTTATRDWCGAASRCGSSAVAGNNSVAGRKWQCVRKRRHHGPPAAVSRARRYTFSTGFRVSRSQGSPLDWNLGCSTAPSYVPSRPARSPQEVIKIPIFKVKLATIGSFYRNRFFQTVIHLIQRKTSKVGQMNCSLEASVYSSWLKRELGMSNSGAWKWNI